MSKECALTRFVDHQLFGDGVAFRAVYWPLDVTKRLRPVVRFCALPLVFLWMLPAFLLIACPLAFVGLVGVMWDMVSGHE